MSTETHMRSADAYWDEAADRFDEEPDHGLRDPGVRAAWDTRLRGWLPDVPSDVLDLGCGTGTLALLAAGHGHRVTAVDRSAAMVRQALAKLDGTDAEVVIGDAVAPPVGDAGFDVVLVRHLLWALPEPGRVLRRWARLLRPGGRMVLVEGRWGDISPVGVAADTLQRLLTPLAAQVHVEHLAHDSALWGREVHDERYAAVVRLPAPARHSEIVDST